ncbi:MAG: tRNA pseudouridine(38-40) synthase TruA [Legionellales bacterium]|nr:tRNA pseudouridine(38-40) synthase TruA [Legionellales bacterium]
MKIALGIEYDGSQFHGWQKQPNLHTVQHELELALSKVADEPISIYCAGRTDTSVHATGQVIHFDTSAIRNMRSWMFGANHHLTRAISVTWAQAMPDDFHARFSAMSRRYCYIIYNHAVRPTINRHYFSWHYQPLDAQLMQEGANYLMGEHDFTSYRALECQAKSPVKTIHQFEVFRHQDFIIFDIKADGFLHHMVRNIAGVLMAIGSSRQPPQWAQDVLVARNRSLGGVTAPPYGLYLTEVGYPEHFNVPLPRTMPWQLFNLGKK